MANFAHLDADITSRSRSITKPGSYIILTQADRVNSTLPNWRDTKAKIMTTPALGAKFVEYEMVIQSGGGTKQPVNDGFQHFLFVLEGEATFELAGETHELIQGGTIWLPPDHPFTLVNNSDAVTRMLWLRRRYIELEGVAIPDPIITNEKDVEAVPEDTYVEKHLIPYDNELGYDMAFNLLIFEPGTHFGFVESHIMEHGLYMLDGRGFYYLNGDLIEVKKDDYIYMAPFCPQYFAATGWETGRYILYKDVNRDYIDEL
ncbi:(S)-ureidoglycine aminohydrolase [Aggregatilinea lenta]|uniref:(S)-ureidoglycine aminohydrolase n=1 Tax=Aggregatilinea lenta TaxID=913108 RepID=UPI000E5A8082|nr:(S)-ureidoglycine aminohydrolase [Aggregatilinea lenta]